MKKGRLSGGGGIRTPGAGFSQYNGLANLTTLLTRFENLGPYYIPQAVTSLLTRADGTRFDWI
jgi:hypothetical protein